MLNVNSMPKSGLKLVAGGEEGNAPQLLQLALAAVDALLLWPAGISRLRLLHYMRNKVPGAAAADAAAAALDKLLEPGLL